MLNKKGLSSSEASRIANFLKEQVKGIELTPDTFQIITSTTVRDGKEFQLDTNQPIDKWMDKIYEKSRFYSLSAWLMEAIKLKESLIQKERNNSFDESTISSTLVTYDAPRPIKANTTLEEYLRTLTIK